MKAKYWAAPDSYSWHAPRHKRIDIFDAVKNVKILPDLGERDERDDGAPIGALLLAIPAGALLWACALLGAYVALGWLAH